VHLLVLGLTLVLYLGLAYGYASLTPIWENPDEPAHFNYVVFVARNHGLPELKPGDWDSALLERLKNGALQPGDSVASIQYENWEPPLFYVVAAPVALVSPTVDPASLVPRLRMLNVVFGAVTLVCAYLVARAAFGPRERDLALAVPLTIVGVPMFVAVSAAISADPLANLLAATVLLLLVRRLRQPGRRARIGWAIVAGALIAIGLLTKLAVGIVLPLALVVIAARSTRVMREAVVLLATTGVVVLPWLARQVSTYGLTDPFALARHAVVVGDQPRFPGLTPDYLVQFGTVSFHSFWAQFGWMAIVAQSRLYWTWGLVSLVAVAGLLMGYRRFRADPVWQLLLLTAGVTFAAYVGYNLSFEQFQGRYLFPAIAPIALLLVAGWAAWLPRRWQSTAVLVIALGLVALNAYTLVRVLVPGFAPSG
jgi:4-amino-4-deoxy-L-arabinose transferase-like glycosyltransferase